MKREYLETIIATGDDDEIDVRVYYEVAPEEKEVRYDSNETGHPGCPASIEYLEVYHNERLITDKLSKDTLREIEDEIWRDLEDEASRYDDYY